MIRNYLKTAWRNLWNNKLYSFINVAGLATGMAVALLIGLWVWDEVSFNSYFGNHKHIAQVMVTQTTANESETDASMAIPAGDALRNNYSDIVKVGSFVSSNGDHTLTSGEKKLPGSGIWAQQSFPLIFTLQMTEGDRNALKDPSSILINKSMANAMFGEEEALNKVVKLDNQINLKVGGVFEDFPHNTTFYDTKILLPWNNTANSLNKQTAWDNHCCRLFIQLNENIDFNKATAKIKNIPTPHITGWKEELLLHPLDKVHLYTEFENGKATGGRIQFVWLFGIIGVFVLFLACINFMNLSTARSEKRAKEVGIRKTMGSLRNQLIKLFFGESVLTTMIAFILAIIIVQFSLPFFNDLSGKEVSITWTSSRFWILTLGSTLLVGIVSGSYPAFYLSRFKPVKVLNGTFKMGRYASIPRKILVVVQFTVSIALIIGTMIVYRQIQFAKNRPAGYAREGLITVPLTEELYGKFESLRNDLLETGAIDNVAESSQPPTHFYNNNSIEWQGKDPNLAVFFRDVNVTPEFGKTIGWKIEEGRDFSRDFATDSSAVIINETGAKITGFKNPVGQTIKCRGKDYTIIGVVKDMITQSPYEQMEPSIFFCDSWMGIITLRIRSTFPVQKALAEIAPVFKKYAPASGFQYAFVDDEYSRKFSDEQRIGDLAAFFAALAIFISCLGLFGLASFVAEQRTKEIGIRKVIGASVFSLWKMLCKDFVLLVTISCFIAVPIAYYFLYGWLQQYQYRTGISWWIFAIAITGALVITLFTVSFQAIKTAIANPVKSLRTE